MLIYVVRHGESTANRDQVHSGWDDVPLSDAGISDAEKIGDKLKSIRFDHIYCSDLMRARQTLEIALPGIQYDVVPLLRELNVGSLMKKRKDECVSEYGESYLENVRNRDFTAYGGENRSMIRQRAEMFLQKLPECVSQKNIAVFTHDGLMRAFMDLSLKCQIPFQRADCPNGCVSVFRCQEKDFFLVRWNI